MIQVGTVQLGRIPRIAVPLTDAELGSSAAAVRAYADIFELRVDQFENQTAGSVREACEHAAAYGVPLLATVRRAEEGGGSRLDEARRLELLAGMAALVDAIDIEWLAPIRADVAALARGRGIPLVVSYHDFTRTPPNSELVAMIDAAKQEGAQIVKLAVTARSGEDTERLLDLLRAHRSKQLIVIAMGEYGAMSRVFFPLVGSLLTYGFARGANAPGQSSAESLFADFMRYSPEFHREKHRNG